MVPILPISFTPVVEQVPDPAPVEQWVLKPWHELTGVDALRLNANGLDQFGYYPPFIRNADGVWCGDWSVNNNWSYLTHADMLKIAEMQIDDDFTVEQKMQYLTAWGDSWGNPMRVPGGLPWYQAPLVKMIGAYYAGQVVEVLERRSIYCEWQGVKGYVPMSRVKSFSRADFGKTHASNPELVHIMTGVSRTNTYREKVKGIVYLPVALGSDFDFAGTFVPAQHWLMDRWLKKVAL